MKAAPRPSLRRRVWLVLAGIAVLGLAVDQAVLYLALRDGYLLGRRLAPFDPPLFQAGHERAFARLARALATGEPLETSVDFDPDLGWAPARDRRMGEVLFDARGLRVGRAPVELARRPSVRRIVALGCSFTEGAEVAGRESWPALLELGNEGVEIANLGVGAYGLDQALLRWRRDGRALAADEVWLGWMPSAAPRVLNLYRPTENRWGDLIAFKPRFVLDGSGGLELVPCPAGDVRAVHDLIGDARAFLEATRAHDAWVAACPAAYAPEGSRIWHWSSAGRLALTLLERRGPTNEERLADPADELTRLVEALILATRDEAQAAGARFRLLILPARENLRAASRPGGVAWAGIASRLAERGVAISDLTAVLQGAGGADEPSLWMRGGHYSPRANALVADALAAHARW